MWRALMRIVKTLPRHLDSDLVRSGGPDRERIHDAHASLRGAESRTANGRPCRGHRAVSEQDNAPCRRPPVARPGGQAGSSADGRSNIAKLTAPGMAKMKSAWPAHLASVRKRVFDHIDDSALQRTAQVLSAVAAQLED